MVCYWENLTRSQSSVTMRGGYCWERLIQGLTHFCTSYKHFCTSNKKRQYLLLGQRTSSFAIKYNKENVCSEAKVRYVFLAFIIKCSGSQSLGFLSFNPAPSLFFPVGIGAQRNRAKSVTLKPLLWVIKGLSCLDQVSHDFFQNP